MIVKIDNQIIADKVEKADSFLKRFVGLLGRSHLEPGGGLMIVKCTGIHMFFMRFAIDIIFVDSEYRITKVCRNVRPWKIVSGGKGTKHTLEVTAGSIPFEDFAGRQLVVEEGP